MSKKRIALLSVFYKDGIVEYGQRLIANNFDLYASGGTAEALKKGGLPVYDIASLVGGSAILGHKVVTLSRQIHAGLLASYLQDVEEMEKLGLPYIDLLLLDFYPHEAEIKRVGSTRESVLEKTDIGGPTMARSGAKGGRIVICNAEDRAPVLQWIQDGEPDREAFIQKLTAKTWVTTSRYDLISARYHSNGLYDGMIGTKVRDCCYGENHWQSPAGLYSEHTGDPLALDKFELVQGSAPSFVNYRDLDRLLQTITHVAAAHDQKYREVPAIAIGCKHGNTCGGAVAESTIPAYAITDMTGGDPLALFGGMVMANFTVTDAHAGMLLSHRGQRVLDGVIAPAFEPAASTRLRRKNERCRLYQNPALAHLSRSSLNCEVMRVPVRGGFLQQPNYTFVLDFDDSNVERSGPLTTQQERDLLLAWAVNATSNSNTITIVKNGMLLGNAVGQQDRVGACELALRRALRSDHDVKDAVACSDSFFPFSDGPEVLANAGVKVILATRGSVNDKEVRRVCEAKGVNLLTLPDAAARGFFGH